MAKQKLEINKTLKGNGVLNCKDLTISIGEEIINLKEKLEMFDGENIKFSFGLAEIIAEE